MANTEAWTCPEGGSHTSIGSGNYALAKAPPAPPNHQPGWRWYKKCQGMWFGPNASKSHCPEGGEHITTGSGEYAIGKSSAPGHAGWRWCHRWQGLWFGDNVSTSNCPHPDGQKHSGTGRGQYRAPIRIDGATVTIEYEQLGHFNSYALDGTPHVDGNAVFILYRITRIENQAVTAKAFVFQRSKIWCVSPGGTYNDALDDGMLPTHRIADSLTIAASSGNSNPGGFIRRVPTSDPESLLHFSSLVPLVYEADESQPVNMKRKATDTETAIIDNATPTLLESWWG